MQEETPPSALDAHQNNFDFLRYLFACMVIFFHAPQLLHAPNDTDWLTVLTRGRIVTGEFAVNGFFTLSGFLIAASWFRCRGFKDFAWRRFLRIYPAWVAVVLVSLLVIAPLGGASLPHFWHRNTTQLFLHIPLLDDPYALLPDAFPTNPVPWSMNDSLWTVRYEILCYGVIALLGALTLLKRRRVILALFAAVYAWFLTGWLPALNALQNTLEWSDVARLPRLLTYFLAGTVFYLFRDKIRFAPWLTALMMGITALACWRGGAQWVFPFSVSYLLFAFAFSPRLRLHRWARYGDFSYGIYLYGTPLLQLLIYRSHNTLTSNALCLFGWFVVNAAAIASWYAIERPCLKLKSYRLPLRPAARKRLYLIGGALLLYLAARYINEWLLMHGY